MKEVKASTTTKKQLQLINNQFEKISFPQYYGIVETVTHQKRFLDDLA